MRSSATTCKPCALFGGEGLFFASMTGPGRVWVQTLPFSRLADRIMRAHRGDR